MVCTPGKNPAHDCWVSMLAYGRGQEGHQPQRMGGPMQGLLQEQHGVRAFATDKVRPGWSELHAAQQSRQRPRDH